MQTDLWPIVAAPFVGSFLGVLILRLPTGAPVLLGRSRCPACAHTLGPFDLVPLVSWLALRGRCRYCAAPLARFYPVIELAALAVALSAWSATTGWLLWASCGLGWTLLALAATDQREQLLPDALTLPLIPAGFVVAYVDDPASLLDHAIGAVAGYAVFVLVEFVYARLRGRAGLGRGDAKLLAAAGAWLGAVALPQVILVAALSALLVAAALRLSGRTMHAHSALPFGPFLALAIWALWLFGPLPL